MQSAIWTVFVPLLVGIIAGFVLVLIQFEIRPRIRIPDKVCQSPEDMCTLTIKVINLTRARITDVSATLLICTRRPDGKVITDIVGDTLPGIHYIKAYSRYHKEYAVQPTYHLTDAQLESIMLGEAYLSYTFEAKHIFTRAPVYKTAEYTDEEIVTGYFESGKSEAFISA